MLCMMATGAASGNAKLASHFECFEASDVDCHNAFSTFHSYMNEFSMFVCLPFIQFFHSRLIDDNVSFFPYEALTAAISFWAWCVTCRLPEVCHPVLKCGPPLAFGN